MSPQEAGQLGIFAQNHLTDADRICHWLAEGIARVSWRGPEREDGRSCLPSLEETLHEPRDGRYAVYLNSHGPHHGDRGAQPGTYNPRAFASRHREGNRVVIRQKIRFLPEGSPHAARMREELRSASQFYSESAKSRGIAVRYEWSEAAPGEEADSVVTIDPSSSLTRSNAKRWRTDANSGTIRHELGHLLGLCDEYQETPAPHSDPTSECQGDQWGTSIMCSSQADEPAVYPHHHYQILRQAYCQSNFERLGRPADTRGIPPIGP
jgi:hypothetical protein